MTALFYVWFAVLDRYFVFLYYHAMGSGFDTTPFGWVTASRYRMSGLVAGGAVLALYTAVVFARSLPLQIAVWLAVALIAAGTTRLRTRVSR